MHRISSWGRAALAVGIAIALVGVGAVVTVPARPASAVTDPIGPLGPDATWLETLNAWREASGLAAVTENTTWSAGDLAHSTYMVETGDFGHVETMTASPFFNAAGADAGLNGNIAGTSQTSRTDRAFVEQWITAPFHAAGMLDPKLTSSGFGSYRHAGKTPAAAATLDVLRGRSGSTPTTATVFPGDESVLPVPQQAYGGGETPNPLTPCAGFTGSTGTPLFALLPHAPTGAGATATVERDNSIVPSCTYDETTYTNPDIDAQTLGRQVLAMRHQVVVIPQVPLTQGSTYEVSVSATSAGDMTPTVTEWSFLAGSQPEVSIGNATVVEGASRTRAVRLTVSLSRPSTSAVSVHFATAQGTASAGSDYTAKSGTLTIPAGTTAGVVSIVVKGDRLSELNESFRVNLSDPFGATVRRGTGVVTIVSDDRTGVEPFTPRVSIGGASLVEGNTGARGLRFTVTLSAAAQVPVLVHYATSPGTATVADFQAKSGTVTIPPMATSALITVTVRADSAAEAAELFTVTLSNPTGAVLYRPAGSGTIIDDD